jgi:hypothetical protein
MDAFEEGTEIVRVYLAASLGEAQQVERVLEEAGVEFGVEVEEFASRRAILSGGVQRGAGFWVRGALVDGAAEALERAGCVSGLVDRG